MKCGSRGQTNLLAYLGNGVPIFKEHWSKLIKSSEMEFLKALSENGMEPNLDKDSRILGKRGLIVSKYYLP